MASFVREVLLASGRADDKEDYSGKVGRLRSSIDEMKAGLRYKIEACYTDFSASTSEVFQEIIRLEEALREVDDLESTMQHLLGGGLSEITQESNELVRNLKELSHSAKDANRMKKAYETLEMVNKLIDEGSFLEAATEVKKVEAAITKPLQVSFEEDEDLVKAFESIKTELISAREKLIYELCQEWDQTVFIEIGEQQDKVLSKRIVLGKEDSHKELVKLIQAMHVTDSLTYRLNKFGAKVMSEFVETIFVDEVLYLEDFDEGEHQLELQYKSPDTTKPLASAIIANLKKVFDFIGGAFDFEISDGCGKTVMELLGGSFGEKLKEKLVKDCLRPAVPTSKDGLENFNEVLTAIEDLQNLLVELKFFSTDCSDLLKYAQNIDSIMANKKCQMVLVDAREIMKEDLHNTKIVEESHPVDAKDIQHTINEIASDLDIDLQEEMLPLPKGMSLDKSVFAFPKCQVSQSAFRIKEIVAKTLEEACDPEASVFLSGRLLITARNIMEMYCDVVPVFHAESLKQFPQQSAITFNNFFYLAHECLTLGMLCANRLKPPLDSRSVTFADLIPRLRQSGVEILLQQMRRQRDELRLILKNTSSGFGLLNGSDLLPAQCEKSIRQISPYLHHLRRLWQDVLPFGIYRRSIGAILNTVVEDLIEMVLALEDIAADTTVQLCSLFGILRDQAPDVFVLDGQPDSSRNDVIRYVKRWNKFNELLLVLNASLREIDDRWAGGKGPLAVEFSPEEVKRLIRALFQNTDRRAAVLARIKLGS